MRPRIIRQYHGSDRGRISRRVHSLLFCDQRRVSDLRRSRQLPSRMQLRILPYGQQRKLDLGHVHHVHSGVECGVSHLHHRKRQRSCVMRFHLRGR